jgi:Fe-S cluster assembly iron-binding protein IscA
MGLALDEPKDNEEPVRANGIDLLVAELAKPFVEDATVDYVKDPYSEGFVITGAGGDC